MKMSISNYWFVKSFVLSVEKELSLLWSDSLYKLVQVCMLKVSPGETRDQNVVVVGLD